MSEIDWDKAPEGATHYHPVNHYFYKYENGVLQSFVLDAWGESGLISAYQSSLIKRPSPAWIGEGLPPVGVVCEAWYQGQDQGHVEVKYSGECMVLWNIRFKHEQCAAAEHYTFKPIRTHEQIAADEREAAIKSLAELIGQEARCAGSPLKPGTCLCIARTLVIDGYRKP